MKWYEILMDVGGSAGALTAVIVCAKHFAPAFRMGSRITKNGERINKLEEKDTAFGQELREMREESSTADRLIIRTMVAMMDNLITGNSHDKLRTTKDELMRFLQDN